jgi:hypothetical protein
MNTLKLFFPLLLSIASFSNLSSQNHLYKGEKVWIIVNYIKEDSKANYEKWMLDIFLAPMNITQDSILKKQNIATRWLKPIKQNEDKTWTYVFLMDPVIPNGDYDIKKFLIKTYGEEKGVNYMKEYETFIATEGQIHVMKR